LTQEDWNVVLFNGMEKTSHWAALYFVALMTFGNYVLFNLLVAILVEGFSAEVRNNTIYKRLASLLPIYWWARTPPYPPHTHLHSDFLLIFCRHTANTTKERNNNRRNFY
jgi:hypothetical protein